MKLFHFFLFFFLSNSVWSQEDFDRNVDSIKMVFKKANNYEIKARVYEKLLGESATTNFLKAIEYGEKALFFAEKSKNYGLKTGIMFQLAFSYMRIGYTPRSIQITQELMKNEFVVKNQDFTILYALFAMNYKIQGDFDKALMYQVLSYNLFVKEWAQKKNYDQRGFFAGPAKLAEVYELKNELDSAYKYGKLGYERLFLLKMEPWSQSFNWENRWIYGKILNKLGKNKEALKMYNDAFFHAEKLKNFEGIQSVYLSKSKLYDKQNQVDSTIKYAKLAFDSGNNNYNYQIIAEAGFVLKDKYLKKKDFEKAIYYSELSTIAKDSIVNIKKSLQMQNLIFQDENQKQKLVSEALENKAKSNIRLLLIGLSFLSILAYILYRNKLKTEKLNRQLSLQNSEIEGFNKNLEQKVIERTTDLQNAIDEVKSAFGKGQSTERKRVSADLHDEIGSALSTIAIFSDLSKRKALKSAPDMVNEIEKIGIKSREMIQTMKDTIWSLNDDNPQDIWERMYQHANELFLAKSINLIWQIPLNQPFVEIDFNKKRSILFAFKEALNNIAKHANAQNVTINCIKNISKIELTIVDDGIGFDVHQLVRQGNGLKNFHERMKEIGGEAKIVSKVGSGTSLTFTFPNA